MHVVTDDDHFRVSVAVKSKQGPSALLYHIAEQFEHPIIDRVLDMPVGFTELAASPSSGALDYIRGNLFHPHWMQPIFADVSGPDNDLNEKLDRLVRRVMAEANAGVFAFGELWPDRARRDEYFRFRNGRGMHDVHMNQGSVESMRHLDGVWQDGGLMFHFRARRGVSEQWAAVFLAFQSQAWHTDDCTGQTVAPSGNDGQFEPGVVRIAAALIHPGVEGAPKTVTLLNTAPKPIDLTGWELVDSIRQVQQLSGVISGGETSVIAMDESLTLSRRGGTISLLGPGRCKIHGVWYTARDANRRGWTVTFE